jgi:hypothetical protein
LCTGRRMVITRALRGFAGINQRGTGSNRGCRLDVRSGQGPPRPRGRTEGSPPRRQGPLVLDPQGGRLRRRGRAPPSPTQPVHGDHRPEPASPCRRSASAASVAASPDRSTRRRWHPPPGGHRRIQCACAPWFGAYGRPGPGEIRAVSRRRGRTAVRSHGGKPTAHTTFDPRRRTDPLDHFPQRRSAAARPTGFEPPRPEHFTGAFHAVDRPTVGETSTTPAPSRRPPTRTCRRSRSR